MDIKPAVPQGPIVRPDDQVPIDTAQDNKIKEQTSNATVGDPHVNSNTAQSMKQAGTEKKGTMKTSEGFLRQSLMDELENKANPNQQGSTKLLGWPNSQNNAIPLFGSNVVSPQSQGATTATKFNSAADAQAKKEAQTLLDRGNQLLKAGSYNEAIEAFDEGFRTYPSSTFVLNKASAYMEAGRYSEAVQAYERYLSDPDASRTDDAKAAMEKAKAAMGGREATATGVAESRKEFDKGEAAFKAGKYQEALGFFDKAYELNPIADFKYNSAACLEKLGKPELAAIKYESYLAEKPNASDAAKVKTHITKLHEDAMKAAQSAFDRGEAAFKAGRYKEAAGAFAEAYEQKPLPNFLYNRAAAYDMAGDKKEAVKNYQLYLTMHPTADDADRVGNRMHKLLKSTGDELIQPDPIKAAQAAAERGRVAYEKGNFREAAAAFTAAYEQEPHPDLLYNIGAAYQRAGDTKNAVKNYQLYLNNHPDAKDADKVRSAINKLLAKTGDGLIDPSLEAAQAAFDRGESAYNAGNFKEAAAAFEEAYKEKPMPDFLYNIGAAYQRAGDTKNAVKNYQLYLNNHPDAKDADKVRNAIHKLLQKTGDDLIQP